MSWHVLSLQQQNMQQRPACFITNEMVTNRAGIVPLFFSWILVHVKLCVCVCVHMCVCSAGGGGGGAYLCASVSRGVHGCVLMIH